MMLATEPSNSGWETETETVGSVENPGFWAHVTNFDCQSTACIKTPKCSSASAHGTQAHTYINAQEAH